MQLIMQFKFNPIINLGFKMRNSLMNVSFVTANKQTVPFLSYFWQD
jgi:hypothetical protein